MKSGRQKSCESKSHELGERILNVALNPFRLWTHNSTLWPHTSFGPSSEIAPFPALRFRICEVVSPTCLMNNVWHGCGYTTMLPDLKLLWISQIRCNGHRSSRCILLKSLPQSFCHLRGSQFLPEEHQFLTRYSRWNDVPRCTQWPGALQTGLHASTPTAFQLLRRKNPTPFYVALQQWCGFGVPVKHWLWRGILK